MGGYECPDEGEGGRREYFWVEKILGDVSGWGERRATGCTVISRVFDGGEGVMSGGIDERSM